MHLLLLPVLLTLAFAQEKNSKQPGPTVGTKAARTEVITPIRNVSFNKNGKAKERKQGGNPRQLSGNLVFDGSMDGHRQVDPQIAVSKDYILHGTNNGMILYDKKGNFVQGVPQREFNDGIDPKLFYDPHNKIFGFDLWWYYDKDKKKPVNVSVSEGEDPRGAWNTYAIPAPEGKDGGAIGYSRKWIGYSFPGGAEQTFLLRTSEVKAGKPATVYHFAGSLGAPVHSQDAMDDMHFLSLTRTDIVITTISDSGDGTPKISSIVRKPHNWKYFGGPPQSPQKGTDIKVASGDRNPKIIHLQSGHLWFSQAVNIEGRAGVQWNQVKLDGSIVQTGRVSHPKNSYIQTTLGVNKNNDVLIGFQEVGPEMFVSPRYCYRLASDAPGTTRAVQSLGEGKGPTDGVSWGDYSCTVVDAGNMVDIWTIQSITNEKGRGETVIGRVEMR